MPPGIVLEPLMNASSPLQVGREKRKHLLNDPLPKMAIMWIIPFMRIILLIGVGNFGSPKLLREHVVCLQIWIGCVAVESEGVQTAQVSCMRLYENHGIVI